MNKLPLIAFLLTLISINGKSINAQITPDSSLGNENSVVTPNVEVRGKLADLIEGGATRGNSLFHSFLEFNIQEGGAAYFANPAVIENIFSRVTGVNASQLFGTLGVLGNANLFFINPNGIIFGPNASLDIRGTFVGSTASELIFPDGNSFSATNPQGVPLLTINVQPTIGLQFGEDSGAIINAADLNSQGNISLIGNSIINRGNISAADINLVGVGSGDILVELANSGEVVSLPSAVSGSWATSSNTESVALQKKEENVSGEANAESLDSQNSLLAKDVSSVEAENLSSLQKSQALRGESISLSASELLSLGLVVNELGELVLSDSGLTIEAGDVVISPLNGGIGLQGESANLSAANNLSLINTAIGVTGDLSLMADNTVLIRDSVDSPFLAVSGGDLLIQGNTIDIFALNHPQSVLVSGGDMILRAYNSVIGDTHYWSGEDFRIEQIDGSNGNFSSIQDPIIRAAGDVSFEAYEGTSLHIIAGGSVNAGTIIITDVETGTAGTDFIQEAITLTDGTVVNIDGSQQATVDIRAGVKPEAIGIPGITGLSLSDLLIPSPNVNQPATSADITIGDIDIIPAGGRVLITNQYQPNNSLFGGDIMVIAENGLFGNGINVQGNGGDGGQVFIDARSNIILNGDVFATSDSSKGGDILLNSVANILINDAEVNVRGAGSGSITINAKNLDVTNSQIRAGIGEDLGSPIAQGGDIKLNVTEAISFGEGSIISNAISENAQGNTGNIIINSDSLTIKGETIVNNLNLSGKGNTGNIIINSDSLTIKGETVVNNLNLSGRGNLGDVIIEGNTVSIKEGSQVGNVISGQGNAGNVYITANSADLINSRIITSVLEGGQGNAGNVSISANNIVLDNSQIFADVEDGVIGNSGNIIINTGILTISNGARLDTINVANGDSGNIEILANTISVTDSDLITDNAGTGNGGNININAEGAITLVNSDFDASVFVERKKGGDINITAESLSLRDGSELKSFGSETLGGSAGNITVKTDKFVTLDNDSNITAFTAENPSNILIETAKLTVKNSSIFAPATGDGIGGNLTVNATDSVELIGNLFPSNGLVTDTLGDGDAGNININTNKLIIRDGAEISTFASENKGNGGDIIINATELVSLTGVTPDGLDPSKIIADTGSEGDAGKIIINTNKLTLQDGSRVSSLTSSDGKAGDIDIKASEIELIGVRPLGMFIRTSLQVSTGGSGDAGNIQINTNRLLIKDGATINSRTTGNGLGGNAGSININSQQVIIDQNSVIDASTSGGLGGSITITAETLKLTNGGQVRTTTSGDFDAGNITLYVEDSLELTGEKTGILANTVMGSTGNGGSIFIDPQTILITDGATIAVDSLGEGEGGDIFIQAGDLTLDNQASISAQTASNTGGNITLEIDNLLTLIRASNISTTAGTAQAGGDGGNITINTPFIIAVPQENSDITANAFLGNGGNIDITTNAIFGLQVREKPTIWSDITASSEFGLQGNINLNTAGIDPTRGLTNLPETNVEPQIAIGCQPGSGKNPSSFSITGTGGSSPKPDENLELDLDQWKPLKLDNNSSETEKLINFFLDPKTITWDKMSINQEFSSSYKINFFTTPSCRVQ